MSLVAPGTCRHCGCHGDSCTTRDGERCVLAVNGTVCSGDACQRAEAERVRKARAEARATAPKRVTRWDIWDAQKARRKAQRKTARGKGRAA